MSDRNVKIEVNGKAYEVHCGARLTMALEKKLGRPALALLQTWRDANEDDASAISATDVFTVISVALSAAKVKVKAKELEKAFDSEGMFGYFPTAVSIVSTCISGDSVDLDDDDEDADEEYAVDAPGKSDEGADDLTVSLS